MTDFSKLSADAIDPNWTPTINPHFRLQWEEAQEAYVLLYPEGMIKLNPSGGEILSRCTGIEIAEIIADLERQFPEAEGLANDVLEFLAIAYQRNWLNHG